MAIWNFNELQGIMICDNFRSCSEIFMKAMLATVLRFKESFEDSLQFLTQELNTELLF